ncbi:MAG: hypothetical protein C4K60_05680 [Ideonella sp. MAG2]|nr:MAG: hypothetical protein C4K60_05680 [Ideonella sp. MAG2]
MSELLVWISESCTFDVYPRRTSINEDDVMALPQTKIFLSNAYASGGAVRFLPNAAGDFGLNASAYTGAPWLSGILDLNGDGVDDLIFGAPGDDDKAVDAGRVFVQLA